MYVQISKLYTCIYPRINASGTLGLIQMWATPLLRPYHHHSQARCYYVNRKSLVMTICIVKWWPFSNQTNIQCYSSILQHSKETAATVCQA